jgi:Tellurite resistance protein TerB
MEETRRILELMFLTAWADERFVGSEALAIQKLMANIPLLRDVRATADIDYSARRRMAEVGLEACVREAAAAIDRPALRELAFQCCAKVGGADGAFVARESQVLGLLREAWGFSEADVERMLVLATR